MWASLFFFTLIGGGIALWLVARMYRARIEKLETAREKIQSEEDRVFDFLRGLGEAFSEDLKPGDLHRLMVKGACNILQAQGGALYLVSGEGESLVPAYVTDGCPPLVRVPPRVLEQAATTRTAVQSYLRLHAASPEDEGLTEAWREGEALLLNGDDPRLTGLRDAHCTTKAVMLAPLIYGGKTLGVLAVSNGPLERAFIRSDFSVFKAITGQSAFALYNHLVYSQASLKKQLDTDLQTAQDIQRILLPATSPTIEHFEIAGVNIPAQQVSGDYFDYIKIDANRYGVVIADVSGKGVPASLIMAMCRSVLRSNAISIKSPAEVLHRVNRQLYPDMREDMFISLAYVVLDARNNKAVLSRAGHDAPLLYRAADESIHRINPPGMALGIDSGPTFERVTGDFSQALEPGDCLVLYTDGVTEALDQFGDEFGMARMRQSIADSARSGAQGIIERLTDDLRDFIGSHPQNDDITLIVIRRT